MELHDQKIKTLNKTFMLLRAMIIEQPTDEAKKELSEIVTKLMTELIQLTNVDPQEFQEKAIKYFKNFSAYANDRAMMDRYFNEINWDCPEIAN